MKKLPILLMMLMFTLTLSAQELTEAQRKEHFNLSRGLAIKGYDPVAYFTENKAVKGDRNIVYMYKGVRYYFSSAQNMEMFKADPMKYEPMYGGYCAYAMGKSGKKVSIDPKTFKVLDGKLYLFYNSWGDNTLPKWNKDEANLKKKADANWAKIIGE